MPKLVKRAAPTQDKEVNKALKAYTFHGLDIDHTAYEGEQLTDCPFCGREGKFSVNSSNGKWSCFVCGEKGGVWKFLEELHKVSDQSTTDYSELLESRGFKYPDTLMTWGVCKSALTGSWMVPGYSLGSDGKLRLQQLYQYTRVGDRLALLPTPGQKHTLFGLNLYADVEQADVIICEGPWDAIKLWEVMRYTKDDGDAGLSNTASQEHCLLCSTNVIGTPSCTVFNDSWTHWVDGKRAMFWYDNDYPKQHPKTGALVPPAGYSGMQRAAGLVAGSTEASFYLHWGDEGYDPELPDSCDVRDLLNEDAHKWLRVLYERTLPVPEEWVGEGGPSDLSLKPRSCNSWSALVNSWRKAVKWTEGLEHGLAVMLASAASTMSIGDQLWFKIIGPASCGKTTLAEALAVNKEYVYAKSTIRGFHSGFISKNENGKMQDTSLIACINGMTLITKDGDTLLQAPNRAQILAEGRDVYDRVSRTHYRNEMGKNYEGINLTWLLCGTSSLRELDSSELGERFLDCVIMDKIEPSIEDDILWRVVNTAADAVGNESNGDARSRFTPAMCDCMELTGGYVGWLRENAGKILPMIDFNDEAKQRCIDIGKWVAYMRAKKEERELAARLVSTHARLAKCLAFVLNKPTVDAAVMKRVVQVGMDTARGESLDIVKAMFNHKLPMEFKSIQLYANLADGDLRKHLRFLKKIGILRPTEIEKKKVWVLTDPIIEMCRKLLK